MAKLPGRVPRIPVLVALLVLAMGLPLVIGTAHGATFTVTSLVDEADSNPGDGFCSGIITPNVCTLRAEVQEATPWTATIRSPCPPAPSP